ncbi:hypothetical protein ACLBSL_32700, partial [Klebsiella pneumoniae]|uniref:hypothetical protein n=1 Tax=Klebsiella pneumoniae TaxID=573 RepID=UPI0039687559
RYLKGDKSIDIDQVTSDLQAKMAEDINKAVEKAPGNVKLEVTSSKSGVNKWEVVEGDGETDLHEVEVDVRAPSKILAHLNIHKVLVIKLQDLKKIDTEFTQII